MNTKDAHTLQCKQTFCLLVAKKQMSEIVKYKGSASLKKAMGEYEQTMTSINDFVKRECKREHETLLAAQAKFDEKLKRVLKSKEMVQLEESASKSACEMNRKMRYACRQIEDIADEIKDDPKLSEDERRDALKELSKTIESEMQSLSKEFPAATRAQFLRGLIM